MQCRIFGWLTLALALALGACGDDGGTSGSDSGVEDDATVGDGSTDAATGDASEEDASAEDGGDADAGSSECVTNGEPVADGTAVASQTAGDCQEVVCDGAGGTRVEADADDVMDDGNACTEDTCEGGSPTHTPVAGGTACSQDGGKVCDDSGACVTCFGTTGCGTDEVCQAGSCAPAACGNDSLDSGETDVDCGGDDCGPCGPGDDCQVNADCAGNECSTTCVANCDDGVKNNTESDIDCGPGCAPCANGDDCTGDGDCASGFCNPDSARCAMPTCVDGFDNGDEEGEDCGGSCPNECVTTCENDNNCVGASGEFCYGGVCVTELNGCDDTPTDRTGEAAVTIEFGGALGNSYSPSCVKVSTGTVVTFSGNFSGHPLVGGVFDGTKMPGGTAPLDGTTASGSSEEFTLSTAGKYPYYCDSHTAAGMYGLIFVE